jgi:NarL family two-component system sensor histidine kinase LiaS
VGFFQSLRGKLILTYTLVTVLALLVVEVLFLVLAFVIFRGRSADLREYLSDVISVQAPAARVYLQTGQEDLPGLQSWLDGLYASGRASLPAQGWADAPAAVIEQNDPIYMLSPQGTVLAQTPLGMNTLVGRVYSPPDFPESQAILDNAKNKVMDPVMLSTQKPGGDYLMAVPILDSAPDLSAQQATDNRALVGILVLTVKPPPPLWTSAWPLFLGVILVTGILLLIGVAPFGALFGFVMSHGLTRRLKNLTIAADAWSDGNFNVQPQDRSKDEISYLGLRMRRMAEHIQNLLQSQQELAMMEERNRLARELHDTVKQQTFATLMQVRAAKNLLEADPATAGQHLEEAEGLIKTSQQELALMIAELRPAALQGQGLAVALKSYLNTWSQHSHIPAEFQVQNERSLPLPVEQAFYRVAQEALSNAARHSRATVVTIRLVYQASQVSLTVSDNGVGFDHLALKPGGIGFQSMHERMAALGGRLVVESSPGKGTNLIATAPIG